MMGVRAGLASVACLMALLAGCQDSDSDGDPPKASPTSGLVDGRYCGLVNSDLVESLLGTELEISGDVLTEAPEGAGVVKCNISADRGTGYITVIFNPVLTGEPPPEAGECEPVSIPKWESIAACWNSTYASVLAFPPEESRFIRINLRLDEPGAQVGPASDEVRSQSLDAAVRVAEDVNTNVNRF